MAQKASGARVLAWHLFGTLSLLLLPSLLGMDPVWTMRRGERLAFGVLLLGYLLSGLPPAIGHWRGKIPATLHILVFTSAVFGMAFLCLMVGGLPYPRILPIAVFGAALLVIPVISARPRGLLPLLPLGATLLGAGLSGVLPKRPVADSSGLVRTALHNLQVDVLPGVVPRPYLLGGGVARLRDQYLLMTGDGLLYLFGWRGGDDSLSVRPLPYRVPANLDDFVSALGLVDRTSAGPGTRLPAPWELRGALGLLTQVTDSSLRVYASHLFLRDDPQCVVVRVSMLEAHPAVFLNGDAGPGWRTVYETTPCLPLRGSNRPEGPGYDSARIFGGEEAGGRMILAGRDSLVLTVGDFELDGVTRPSRPISQDSTASYGKTMLIHVSRGTAEILSTGHRNPQGLFRDTDGSVWLTEHGPQGGDELNLIVAGADYGWPSATYGTNYGTTEWPLSPKPGSHEGFEAPVHAWIPSVGVSDLVRIERGVFAAWRGDLLVATLKNRALYRLRSRDRHIVYAERIALGKGIRALVEGEDGRIVLWTDDHAIVSIRPNRGETGEARFAVRCGGCHAIREGPEYNFGPHLAGVVGRPVGSVAFSYSPALLAVGGIWTPERLDSFLANPSALAPGTKMAFPGEPDPAGRAAIIEYLRTHR